MRLTLIALLALSACTSTSTVMPVDDGSYLITASSSGGESAANDGAFQDATRFCATQGAHPVVASLQQRDTYGAAAGGSYIGGGGGMVAIGNASLRFRCVK